MALTFDNSAPKAALDAITALLAGGDFQLRASATPLADLLFQTSGGAFGAGTSANPSVAVSTTIADDTTPIAGTIDNFRLTANIGYLDSNYDKFCTDLDGPSSYATAPTSTCGKVTKLVNGTYLVDQDYTSLHLVRAPKWTTNLGAEYTAPLGDAGSVTARLSMLYRTSWYSTVLNDAAGKTGDFTLLDGSLGWDSADGRFRVQVWGKNLTKKTWVSALTPTAQFFIQRFYGPPRTFGATLGAKF